MSSPSMENKFQEIRDLLNEAWDMTSKKALREKLESAAQCLGELGDIWDENVAALEEEFLNEKENFEFRFRQLRGQAEKFKVLAARRPESACNAFKAEQVNQVLSALQEIMEPVMQLKFPLVSGAEENSYSDVALLLQLYLDVAAVFAKKRYDISYDYKGEEVPRYRRGYYA